MKESLSWEVPFYIISVTLLCGIIMALFTTLSAGKYTHNVRKYPLPTKQFLTEPYVCINEAGDLATCGKDRCQGAWKPPGAHHCSMCGTCRLEFDHHCPWVRNCITSTKMRAFLALLCLVPVIVALCLFPVTDRLWSHVRAALTASRADPWTNEHWWSWFGSWIFIGGPIGRWVVGTVLGFRVLKQQRPAQSYPGIVIEYPHLRIVAAAWVAAVLSLICLGLMFVTLRYVLRGQTTLEALRPYVSKRKTCGDDDDDSTKSDNRQLWVCIPGPKPGEFRVHAVAAGERVYDLGSARANLSRTLFHSRQGEEYVWPELNPVMLERMQNVV
ncbi:hypothetical protein FISHEDRAFT_65864 [Fistulina hepatica ATCC 64428]|uniref:Palmitoyltransferase n=1 Tax=Fistulina hepatica ATCC 64428 TaxID=1128425 RepID=A0A0D7AE43_9AGAR|nr:hypothetical protein FISHEDRAFT_65864 [Fistulina hepatica ATCC 64428]